MQYAKYNEINDILFLGIMVFMLHGESVGLPIVFVEGGCKKVNKREKIRENANLIKRRNDKCQL